MRCCAFCARLQPDDFPVLRDNLAGVIAGKLLLHRHSMFVGLFLSRVATSADEQREGDQEARQSSFHFESGRRLQGRHQRDRGLQRSTGQAAIRRFALNRGDSFHLHQQIVPADIS